MAESCEFIRDLMPVVASGGASEETKAEVEAHIAHCPACKGEYDRILASSGKTAFKEKPRPATLLLFLLKLLGAAALVVWGAVWAASKGVTTSSIPLYYGSFFFFGAGVYTAFVFRRGRYAVVIGAGVCTLIALLTSNHYFSLLIYNFTMFFVQYFSAVILPTAAAAGGLLSGLLLRYALGRRAVRGTGATWAAWLRGFAGRKPFYLRMAGVAAGIALFAALCFYVFGTVGDPAAILTANGMLKEYFDKNYAPYGFQYTDLYYSGYDTYGAQIQLASDPNVTFSVICFKLQTMETDFPSALTQAKPQFKDLVNALGEKVDGILKDRPGYRYCIVDSSQVPDVVIVASSPKKEMDPKTSADYLSVMLLTAGEFSPGEAASLLTDYYNGLKSKGIVFSSYAVDIRDVNPQGACTVSGVTPEQIEGGNLARLLEDAKSSPQNSASGIYYFGGVE